MITVARIIDRLNVGGPALHVSLAARGLDRTKFRTVLIHGNVEPSEADMTYLADAAEADGIERIIIPELGRELRPLRDTRTLAKLVDVLRKIKPDVVHTHKAKAGALGRTAATILRVPAKVHTFHGHVFHGYFSPAKTRVFLGIERALAHTTDRLIALSDSLADELSGQYRIAPRDKFAVVPLGLDLAPFRATTRFGGGLRHALGIASDVRLVGIVGRMVPVKDHPTFLRAAQILAQRDEKLAFVVVGGGELESEMVQLVETLGLRGRIHLCGWRRELAAIYSDLDAVALSSVNEGTPVTLIEAMASGAPVASTTVGGVADLLQNGARGELAKVGDPASLADAIERALAPAAEARAATLRDTITRDYGAPRLCADLGALYTQLLGR